MLVIGGFMRDELENCLKNSIRYAFERRHVRGICYSENVRRYVHTLRQYRIYKKGIV